ncbi:hypothetical protein, partial [Vibrio vulnificus]
MTPLFGDALHEVAIDSDFSLPSHLQKTFLELCRVVEHAKRRAVTIAVDAEQTNTQDSIDAIT